MRRVKVKGKREEMKFMWATVPSRRDRVKWVLSGDGFSSSWMAVISSRQERGRKSDKDLFFRIIKRDLFSTPVYSVGKVSISVAPACLRPYEDTDREIPNFNFIGRRLLTPSTSRSRNPPRRSHPRISTLKPQTLKNQRKPCYSRQNSSSLRRKNIGILHFPGDAVLDL